MAEAQAALAALTQEHHELTARVRALRDERDTLRASVDEHASEARRLRGEQEKIEAQLHERQIKLQEVRVRREDLTARVAEELTVDLAAQYVNYQPDQEQDWPRSRRRSKSFARKSSGW